MHSGSPAGRWCGSLMGMHLLPLVTVVALFAARTVEMAVRRGRKAGEIHHPRTWWGLFLGGTAVVASALAEYVLRPHPVVWPLYALGLATGLASFALRASAAAHLGAYWSMHIEVRKDHPLVRSGPYAWVRHPVYSAAVLELLGAILILQSWRSLAVFVFLFIPVLAARIVLEERAMIAHFADTYRNYMATTPALVRLLPPGK